MVSIKDHTAYIAIGSNLGDRINNCKAAIQKINAHPHISVTKQSTFIETNPAGYVKQNDFINGAIEIKTSLEPQALLEALQIIEIALGRKKTFKWGPRVIDLDILLYDNIQIHLPHLTIPHPEIKNRDFVQKSLREINSDI